MLGDLNGHHQAWGCSDTNTRGEIIETFIEQNGLCFFTAVAGAALGGAATDFVDENLEPVKLEENITVLGFLGKDPMNNLTAASNLKELIYEKFKGVLKGAEYVLSNHFNIF